MKQIIMRVDRDGHVRLSGAGGVNGDHHAALLTAVLEQPPEGVTYYRFYFAADDGRKVMSERLTLTDGVLVCALPGQVTGLGATVQTQLCGYDTDGDSVRVRFQSDAVTLHFTTDQSDMSEYEDTGLTDHLQGVVNELETFAEEFDLRMGTVTPLNRLADPTASLERQGQVFTLNMGLPKPTMTAGDGIAVSDEGEISVVKQPVYYTAFLHPVYGHLGINESRPLTALAGSVIWVAPPAANVTGAVMLYTSGEQVYYPVHCLNGQQLTETVPAGAVQPNRAMALYITPQYQVVYLNPYQPPQEDVWHETATAVAGLTAYYKKSGSMVCVRFKAPGGYVEVDRYTPLFTLPAGYVSGAVSAVSDGVYLPAGSTTGNRYGFCIQNNQVCFSNNGNYAHTIDIEWESLQLLFMI